MNFARRFALLTALILLGVAAAPAHATLLARSDGNGLVVMDKNGLDDKLDISGATREGRSAYRLENLNISDVFKFDRQFGCFEERDRALCDRNGPAINIQLGAGSDVLDMDSPRDVVPDVPVGNSSVAAGPGNDHVDGHGGRDQLHGQTGEDTLRGFAGNDTLFGDESSDRLEGGDGNDTLEGESGADVLIGELGADVLRGDTGNDTIVSREPEGSTAVADEVGCGGGFDNLEADLKDTVPASCEEVDQGAVGETPNVRMLGRALRVAPTGQVNVRLRCPRGVKRLGCKGTLRLRLAKAGAKSSRSRKVRYRIRAGKRKTVTLRLTGKDVKTLRKRRGKKPRGILVSVEKGRKGLKTTVRNPRLNLRGG